MRMRKESKSTSVEPLVAELDRFAVAAANKEFDGEARRKFIAAHEGLVEALQSLHPDLADELMRGMDRVVRRRAAL